MSCIWKTGLSSNDASFDAPSSTDDDEEMMSPSQYLEDKTYDPELIVATQRHRNLIIMT